MLEDSTNKLHQNLERIAEVLRSDYSYIEQKEWLYVDEVIDELHKNMDLLIQESQADIRVHKEFEMIYFNASYFYSFIYNLVSNSIKYRHPDRPCIVDVHFEITDDQHVRIRVKDNGLGIDMDKDGDKIFKLFRRIHDHTEGSGVGLHLIKKMIERSRGTISVTSKLGEGTEFTIRLLGNHK
ncbi:hypothetical protein KFE98_21530 [bacterium SCSIO 12741]|nr:hypothetical protein KFE98_21530 [bacterium SCSIO 12741]